ncbi:protein of unknown function [Cupriavidus taiwanensis]|nr:protein of unknown function [Cupriavidus taiwanensis]
MFVATPDKMIVAAQSILRKVATPALCALFVRAHFVHAALEINFIEAQLSHQAVPQSRQHIHAPKVAPPRRAQLVGRVPGFA